MAAAEISGRERRFISARRDEALAADFAQSRHFLA